jgi:hypothetical protein
MIRRCCNPADPAWDHYGGNGVIVCGQWLLPDGVGFKNFAADLGRRPVDEQATARSDRTVYQSLGRYRDEGNYEPGNCEWMTRERQAHHQGPRANSSSKYKGVTWNKNAGAWAAQIYIGKQHHLGFFKIEEDAAAAYDKAASEAWGTDCWLNFPDSAILCTTPGAYCK